MVKWGANMKKQNANRQKQHVICALRGLGRFNSACGINSFNHQFTSDCNYGLREKWINFIICKTNFFSGFLRKIGQITPLRSF